MTTRDTRIEGEPGSIESVADWLRSTFTSGATTFGDAVFSVRSQAASAWTGPTSDGMQDAAKRIGDGADVLAASAETAASQIETLAGKLRKAQEEMESAREQARGAGLTVSDTVIHHPGPAPASVPDLPAGASEGERLAHQAAVSEVAAYNAQISAWDAVNGLADDAEQLWAEAMDACATFWSSEQQNVRGLTKGLFEAAAMAVVEVKTSRWFRDAAAGYKHSAKVWQDIFDGMVDADGRLLTDSAASYYEAKDRIGQQAALASDAEAHSRVRRLKLVPWQADPPPGLLHETKPVRIGKTGFIGLDVFLTGVAITQDIENGESVEQATASNVGGMLAGIGAGAAIGSLIPVPGLGTAVGAIVGAGVGIVTSGAIDHLFEEGADTWGDMFDAARAGVDDLYEAVADIGDGLSNAWNSIF